MIPITVRMVSADTMAASGGERRSGSPEFGGEWGERTD
jgi:hypothetical protein